MYRGTPSVSKADDHSLPSGATMLTSMNRLPTLPARPSLIRQPHSSQEHYEIMNMVTPRPDNASGSHDRVREPEAGQVHAQQLPSLRTLLNQTLFDNKQSDPAPQFGNGRPTQTIPMRYGSVSPTLKRRCDLVAHDQDNIKGTNALSRMSHPDTNSPHTAFSDPHSSNIGFDPNPSHRQLDSLQHESHTRTMHYDVAANDFHTPSTGSTTSIASDPPRIRYSQSRHEEMTDSIRPVRRRTDGSSRGSVRTSRCVGQREIPGEGMCWVYEDGTYCRVVIDGEAVNPSWGITKAGKPRKRLAQACLTCREKKIKCEPGYPKCHQCAKSQRHCRG